MAKKEKKVKAVKAAKPAKAEKASKRNGDAAKGGGVLFAAVSLVSALFVIAAVLAAFLFVIVKMNALGVAETYRESIEKVPVLNLALPKEEASDPREMELPELINKYEKLEAENDELKIEIDASNKKIDDLSKAKNDYEAQTLIYNEKTAQLEQKVMTLEAEKKQLDDMKYELERAAASGDKEAFAQYFESVSPEVAQEIYSQIIQSQKSDEEERKFISLFQTLDTKASAQIVETLGSSRLDFIAETLSAIKKDVAADIIGQLTPELAAQVTLKLSGN